MHTSRIAKTITFCLVTTVAGFVSAPSGAAPAPSSVTPSLLSAINAERSARGLSTLSLDQGASAQGAAEEFLSSGVPHPAGYDWLVSGDLISKEISVAVNGTTGEAVSLWMGSQGHRTALLDQGATQVRIGAACRSDGRLFAVAQILTSFGAAGPTPAASPVVSSSGGVSCAKPPATTPVPPTTTQPPSTTPGSPTPPPAPSAPALNSSQRRCFVAHLSDRVLGHRVDNATLSYWDALTIRDGRGSAAAAVVVSAESLGRMVTDVYRNTLDRGTDAGGLAYWSGQLRTSGSVAGVSAQVFSSPESYRLGGNTDEGYVRRLYRLVLTRDSDAGGLAYWTGLVQARGRQAIAAQMLGSTELKGRRVDAIHAQILGSRPSQNARAYEVGVLSNAGEIGLMTQLAQSDQFFANSQGPACA